MRHWGSRLLNAPLQRRRSPSRRRIKLGRTRPLRLSKRSSFPDVPQLTAATSSPRSLRGFYKSACQGGSIREWEMNSTSSAQPLPISDSGSECRSASRSGPILVQIRPCRRQFRRGPSRGSPPESERSPPCCAEMPGNIGPDKRATDGSLRCRSRLPPRAFGSTSDRATADRCGRSALASFRRRAPRNPWRCRFATDISRWSSSPPGKM